MKKVIQKIADKLPGLYFRAREISAGVYLAEGTDLWSRTLERTRHTL